MTEAAGRSRADEVTVYGMRAVSDAVYRFAQVTPLRIDRTLQQMTGHDVHLKLDCVQPTGSFKIRGAAAKIGSLSPEEQARGVITASTGNHGRAVAHVARELGVAATICVSDNVPPGKIALLESLGCRLDVGGGSQDEAFDRAISAAAEPGGPMLVHSILDPVVLCGQGTCGLEIVDRQPSTALVLVPLSGGGLIAGVAVAVKTLLPHATVIGVSMEGGAVMHASLAAGHPVQLPEVETLADSLQGGIGLDNDTSFPITQRLVDDVILVTEDEIAAAMVYALEEHRLILEGAGAVGIAALMAHKAPLTSGATVVVCSGANAELPVVARLADS